MSGISFKFNKTVQQRNKVNVNDGEKSDEEEPTDFVLSVDRRQILSTKPKEEEKELVIPLIVQNKWRLPDEAKLRENLKVITRDGETETLEQQAANEIIAQTKEFQDSRERSFKDENYEIPLILRNKIPEGYETDNKLDVSLRAEQSTLEDYDRIPVDKFGLAMLRGMGWKPGMAIGLRNKECVKPIEVVLRPKGLGLGADRSKALQNAKLENDEDGNLLLLAIGSYVLVKEGNNKGSYGQVESIDDDTGRVYIKLALSSKQIHLPELFLQVVSQKEYLKEGKVMNKNQYDDAVNERESSHRSHKKKRSKEKRKKRSRSRSPKHNRISGDKESKEYKSRRSDDEKPLPPSWLMPQIKVRLVDGNYKKGKYYNIKVIIEDVLSPVLCICRTMDGKVLEDINPSMLETVIPRSEPSYIMVVRGSDKGMVGKIVRRDKSQCTATVQLFPDNVVSNFSYDDICEFVGDVSLHD